MKRMIVGLLFSGLVSIGLALPSSAKREQPEPSVLINEVRQAHSLPQDGKALSAIRIEALKVVSTYSDPDSELPNFFERKLEVSIDGKTFRRYQVDPLGLKEEKDVFDGQAAYHTEIEKGIEVVSNQMEYEQLRTAELNIRTFGLVPILNQLSDPATDISHLGCTARKEDKFEVKTASGSWILYADQWHIIRKVVVGSRTIEYGDYRSVEGIRLPFIQRVYQYGKLRYELIFNKIELNRAFPSGYFNRDTLSKPIGR